MPKELQGKEEIYIFFGETYLLLPFFLNGFLACAFAPSSAQGREYWWSSWLLCVLENFWGDTPVDALQEVKVPLQRYIFWC